MNQFASQRADTTPARLGLSKRILQHSGISELVVAIVRQSGVSHSKFVEPAQVGSRVSNLMQAFHAEGRDESARSKGASGTMAVHPRGKVLGICIHKSIHDIDLI
jgi:hypothetical protein